MAARHVLLLAVLMAAAPNSGSAATSRPAGNRGSRRFNSRPDNVVSRVDNPASHMEAPVDPRIQLHPRDCSELPPGSRSGVHLLQPGLDISDPPVVAYCDLDTDGGGWTVIQRRGDIKPREDFNRTWAAYREGFGRLDQEFWWGLENLRRLTGPRDRLYELKVELTDFDDGHRHALYGEFRVASEADGYRLAVFGYSGTAGDSLGTHYGSSFSTRDNDQDRDPGNCAQLNGGGWWFVWCLDSNLNGPCLPGQRERNQGVIWHHWRGQKYSLKETEMKLRPVSIY